MAQSGESSVIDDPSNLSDLDLVETHDSPEKILCLHSKNLSLLLEAVGNLPNISLTDLLPEVLQRDRRHVSGALGNESLSSQMYCPTEWDDLVCWPETPEGKAVTVPCFPEFNGIFYDTTRNATRSCLEGGNWTRSDFSQCVAKMNAGSSEVGNLAIQTGVYFFGYCLSLCALVIATIIFLAFKELRCLRNIIHTHLMITYILADTLWIITSSTTFTSAGTFGGSGMSGGGSGGGGPVSDNQTGDRDAGGNVMEASSGVGGQTNQVPCVTFILLHYFHLTNFFWMGVEGLYLYVLVVKTFVSENIKLRVYACVGWGVPLIVVMAWSIAKWITQSESADTQITDPEFAVSSCLWLPVNDYDWIYKTPVILVLSCNLIFLVQIMWVLITKLRSAMNPETQQSIKAAKAFVVLMPLLGITYVLVLSGSKEPTYEYLRALLISTQGFLVALLYCFLNGEVRQAIRHRWNRLWMMGPICCDFKRRRQMHQMSRDWSPRSRTESIRYPRSVEHDFRKRESVTSAATSVTTINSGTGSAGSGGGRYGHNLLDRESTSSPGNADGSQTVEYQLHHQVPSTITDGGGGGRRGVSGVVLDPTAATSSVTTSLLEKMNNHITPKSMNGQSRGTSLKPFTTRTERDNQSQIGKMDYLQVPVTKY